MDVNKNSNDSLISLIEVSENESENDIAGSEYKENKSNVVLKNVQRVIRNWRKCLACDEKKYLQLPSKEMRSHFIRTKKMYIEKNDRVCNFHAQSQNWNLCCKTTPIFSSKIINEMIDFLLCLSSDEKESELPLNIGLSVSDFKQILFELGIAENPTKEEKKIITAVKLYIERLHTGHTYQQMALRYKMSRVLIGKIVKRGRDVLLQHFVPNHLGYRNCTRQWLKNHTTDFSRMIYCDNNPEKIVIVCDGTYIYCCSSTNHAHQRQTYSGHKHRNLFKIMKFISVDGVIVDTFGPFRATQNDAEIIEIIFEKSHFKNILRPGDVVLVDRGFRNCMKTFQRMKLDAKIPGFIQKGTKGQLTTKQCNDSRLITKMRFAIETANGRMKMKWHLFNKMVPSILSIHLMSDYKIGCAILNSFGKPIICDKNDFSDIGTQMLNRVNRKNELCEIINKKKFQQSRKYFQLVSSKQLFFPTFNTNQLKKFSLGNYAIKQALSYTADIKKKNGDFPIYTLPPIHLKSCFRKILEKNNFLNAMLIFTPMSSRFRSNKTHDVYVLYDASKTNRENILYYCTCQHGRRTVGCCSHVMTIVYYFGYGRHHNNDYSPASHLNNFFDLDLS